MNFEFFTITFMALASLVVAAVIFMAGWYVGWRNRGAFEHKQAKIKKGRF